jgi:hypothetical protein
VWLRKSVTGPRKFIDQSHYNTWLSRERFFGKNRRKLQA